MSKNRVCAVIGCRNINYYFYKDSKTPQIKFFRFPRLKAMCAKWIEQLNRLDLYPILEEKGPIHLWVNYRVCSEHFTDRDYEKPCFVTSENLKKQGWLLVKNAIPSRNLGDGNEIYLAPGPELDSSLVEDVPVEIEDDEEPEESVETEELCGWKIQQIIADSNEKIKAQAQKISLLEEKLAESESLIAEYELKLKECNASFEEADKMTNNFIDFHQKSCSGDCDNCRKDFALDLYMNAPRMYKMLQEKYLLPHTLVLYRWKYKKESEVVDK